MNEFRTGNHWGVTIVREGTHPVNESGHRPDAELVAVVVNGDRALAERICGLLNSDRREWADLPADEQREAVGIISDSCTCHGRPDPDCPVHHGRQARGPKPPNMPGCICDGSGRTCPRHGAVL